MNKKAMFFSLSVVLFLLLLLVIFNNQSKIKEDEVKSYAGRAQLIVMDNFVKDFDQYYIEQILETAAKHAFVEKSASGPLNFNRNQLKDTMEDGMEDEKTTKKNFEQALGTLAFTIPESDRDFSYDIISVSQPTFDTIKIDFEVDYEFNVFDTIWREVDKPFTVEFPVWGITHPDYSPGIIDDSWVEDTNGCIAECLLSNLMAGGHFDCPLEVKNIIPSHLVDWCLPPPP